MKGTGSSSAICKKSAPGHRCRRCLRTGKQSPKTDVVAPLGAGIPGAIAPRRSDGRFRVWIYAFQSTALAGFAVPRSPLPLPIPPRCESGHYPHRRPQGHQQYDHHYDDCDKGFGHRGSPPLCYARAERATLIRLEENHSPYRHFREAFKRLAFRLRLRRRGGRIGGAVKAAGSAGVRAAGCGDYLRLRHGRGGRCGATR